MDAFEYAGRPRPPHQSPCRQPHERSRLARNDSCYRIAEQVPMMKVFRRHPGSEGPRREFKITLGLRAGYGAAGRIYDLEEAVRTAHRWMMERAARGEPFLSGMFTRGEVVYADSGGEAESRAGCHLRRRGSPAIFRRS